jgi:hypothetical protein
MGRHMFMKVDDFADRLLCYDSNRRDSETNLSRVHEMSLAYLKLCKFSSSITEADIEKVKSWQEQALSQFEEDLVNLDSFDPNIVYSVPVSEWSSDDNDPTGSYNLVKLF